MAELSDVYQITREQLGAQQERADLKVKGIFWDGNKYDLKDYVAKMDPDDVYLLSPEEDVSVRAVRDAVGLYLEIYRQLARPFPELAEPDAAAPKPAPEYRMTDFKPSVPKPLSAPPARLDPAAKRKRDAIASYAAFAAATLVKTRLDEALRDKPVVDLETVVRQANYFKFEEGRDNTVGGALSKYFGTLKQAVDAKKVADGHTLALMTRDFFAFLRDEAKKAAQALQPDDYKFDGLTFDVAGQFHLRGYEDTAAGARASALAFKPMKPHEVVGNTHAKKLILRYADRMALYDFERQMNPIMERGGLAWSCLWDGFPGTGKTSLLKVGKTRLHERMEQIQDAWAQYGTLWEWIVLDDRFKDEFYGKSGKNFRAELERAANPRMLHWIEWEDIDLWMEDRDNTTGGAGKDLLNIGMQFLDGGGTVVRGNALNNATTNEPTGLDNALRQRFHIRFDASGPETWYHFADLLQIKLAPLAAGGKVVGIEAGKAEPGNRGAAYKPFEQEDRDLETGMDHEISAETLEALRRCRIDDPSRATYADLGRLCRAFKDVYPRFTGRPVHSISEALKDRSADFDIPEDWFTVPERFISQPYERKVEILGELYRPISGLMIVEEIDRYYTAETRYVCERHEAEVQRSVERYKVDMDARKRLVQELGQEAKAE